eukprot:g8349.t1
MEAREWELDHSYIRCGGFFQCTRRTFEVVVLILSWWVIAGVIVIEYKYINAQEFAFFLTGMTNTFAGGILLAIFCGGRLCSAYGTSPRRSPERFELDEDDGFRGPNPRLSGGGEFRVPIDDSDIVLPQQGHVVTSSCEHHLQDRGRGPEGSDEGNRKAKASSRGNTTTALSFSLPISNFESFLLIILGILNGIEYGILNKALMILPIATRQMLGSSSTLFQMVFAFLWRLPPAITPKLMLCGGVLMLGGVLQGLQTFVVHNEASSVGLGGAKVAVSGGDSAGALGSSSSSSSSAGGSSGLKRARATEQADASLRTTSASSSITTDGDESQSSDSAPESDSLYSSNAGFLLQIFAMLLSSNKGCLMQHVLQRTPGIARLDKVALGSRTMIYSGITCLVLSLVTEAQKHDVWKVVADTGLILKLFGIASILCVMVCAELRLLQITSTVTFGVFGLLHSIPIVLSGVLLFGDTVGLFDGLGFLVCLAGSYWYMLLVKGAGKDDALPPAGREKDPGIKNNNPPEGGEVTLTSPLEEWRRKPRYARLKNDEDYNSINVL